MYEVEYGSWHSGHRKRFLFRRGAMRFAERVGGEFVLVRNRITGADVVVRSPDLSKIRVSEVMPFN